MKKRFVLFVMLVAAVMALNLVAPAFAATVSLDVETGKEISQIQSASDEPYTVQGVVVASNTRGVVITDGEAGVMIYGSGILDVVKLKDFIEISATASEYNNILQLNYTSETPVTPVTEGQAPTLPETKELTAEIAQGWKDAADQDPSGLSVKDVMPYSWTATATRVGSYWALTPDWAANLGFAIEPLYVNATDFTLQEGVRYNAEGYFIGFNNTSSTPFAGMMLTKCDKEADQMEVEVAPYLAVQYTENMTVKLDVNITHSEVTTYKATSSDESVATWNADDEVLDIHSAGTTTITVIATADETKTATVTLVVYSEMIFDISEIKTSGTYWITGKVVAKTTNAAIVSDGTSGIMVYDVKQVSKLVVGDDVEVAGTVTQYNGLWQFSYNPGCVVTYTGHSEVSETPAALTDSMLKTWTTSRSQADVKLYSWTGVAGLRNGYNIYNIEYDGVVIESEVALANIELGTTYAFQGYFTGYNATNEYASFMITEYNAVPEAEQQTYLGFNRDVINLGIGSMYTLSPILGGAAKDATVEYTGYDENIIEIKDGVVTGLVGGDTEITATVAGISRTLEVHVSTAINQVTTANQFYTVIGKVVAKTNQSLVIHDGTAGILVYDRDAVATYAIDDILQVSGYVSLYNNMLQFSYNGNLTVTKLEDREINVPDPTELQPEKATEWATMASPILPINCQAYTWSATVGKSGNFFTINIEGSDTVIEPAYMPDTFTLTEGETVTVTGYFIGYATGNRYAAIAITNIVHAEG